MDVTGDGSKARCCKEQYWIGTRNVRSMKQGKLEVVKQEMARVNIGILGISALNGPEWENLIQMTIMSIPVGKNPLEELALIINKRVQNAVLGCSLKNDRNISVHFQGKPFNITVIQLYAPVTPQMAAHQAPPSLGFSRQEHWSGLPFPSPMHESEK